MRRINYIIIGVASLSMAQVAGAQSVNGLLGAPFNAAGGALSGVGVAHAGIAPTVNSVSPTLESGTDGVTNAIGAIGQGVTGVGANITGNGLQVGTGANGQALVSVGATTPQGQGSVAAVLNTPHP